MIPNLDIDSPSALFRINSGDFFLSNDGTLYAGSPIGNLKFVTYPDGGTLSLPSDTTALGNLNQVGDGFRGYRYAPAGDAFIFFVHRARGDSSVPTTLVSGDGVYYFEALGHDGLSFRTIGNMQFDVDGAVSTGTVPGRFIIKTANSSGVSTEALRVDSTQSTLLAGKVTEYNGVVTEGHGVPAILDYNQVALTASSTGNVASNCSGLGFYRISAYVQFTSQDLQENSATIDINWRDVGGGIRSESSSSCSSVAIGNYQRLDVTVYHAAGGDITIDCNITIPGSSTDEFTFTWSVEKLA